MKKLVIIAVVAILLAASLGYTFIVSETNHRSYDSLNAQVQAINSNLTFLQGKLTVLNSSLIQLSNNLHDLNVEFQQGQLKTETNASSQVTYIPNSNISALQKDIANVQTGLLRVGSNINLTSTQVSDIQANVSFLSEMISNLKDNIFSVETDLPKIQANITDIKSGIVSLSTQVSNIQKDVAATGTSLTSLQSSVASLEARVGALEVQNSTTSTSLKDLQTKVNTLEAQKAITIRIDFLNFTPWNLPPGGSDYLFDAEVQGPGVYALARTGHSRFFAPRYLDLVIPDGEQFIGTQVTITIVAYWHLSDQVIDIDPNPAHGRVALIPGTNANGGNLTLTYTIGKVLTGTVDGRSDGYLTDLYDAYLQYKIETLT